MKLQTVVTVVLAYFSSFAFATQLPVGKTTLKLIPEMQRQETRSEIASLQREIQDVDQQLISTRGESLASRGVFGNNNPQTAVLDSQISVLEMQRDELASRRLDLEDSLAK